MLKLKIKRYLFPILIISFLLFLYRVWFFDSNPLTKGDFGFHLLESLATVRINLFFVWFADSFGRILIDMGQAPSYALYGFLAKFFNLDFSWGERIIHFWPIAILTPLTSYFLFNNILKNKKGALIGSIAYSFNSYFIILQTGHITLSAAFAVAPLAIYLFKLTLEKNKISTAILTGFIFMMCSAYETRAFYIIIGFLLLYFIYHLGFNTCDKKIKTLFKTSIFGGLPVILFALLNSYWVVGFLKLNLLSDNSLFSRGLFGGQYMNIQRAITLFHPWWTGVDPAIFNIQPIPVYFWLIPIFAFLGLYLNRKNKNIVFFGIISLIGILLTKQVDNPFPNLHPWLFANIPGFNAFREASKFYFLIALGYSVLIGSFVAWLWENWKTKKWQIYTKWFLTSLIAVIFLINTIPLITGEIGTLFVPRHIPQDYLTLKDFILNQNNYFRTFWSPTNSRWGIYTNQHPKVSNVSINGSEWKSFINETDFSNSAGDQRNKIVSTLKQPFSNSILDFGSIKYVIVPLEDRANDDNFYVHYGMSKSFYDQELSKLSYLQKIDIGTQELTIYENKNYKPYISTLTKLYSLENLENLDYKYYQITNQLGDEFGFVVEDQNKNQRTTNLYHLFENITPENISQNQLAQNIALSQADNLLLVNTAKPKLILDLKDQKLILSTNPEQGLEINSQAIRRLQLEAGAKVDQQIMCDGQHGSWYNQEPAKDGSWYNQEPANYYYQFGTQLQPIDFKQKTLGSFTKPVIIFSTQGQNQIQNPSFETGLWSEKVGDCNAYDDKPILDMKLNQQDSSHGSQSLQLEATKHSACTGQKAIEVKPGQKYAFSFDYQSSNGRYAGYHLSFNDELGTATHERLPVGDGSWQSFIKLLEMPENATQMNLTIYSYAVDNKTNIITRYDNFKLFELKQEEMIDPQYQPEFEQADLDLNVRRLQLEAGAKVDQRMVPDGQHGSWYNQEPANVELTYTEPGLIFKNIIPNPSFKEGLWSEQVGDCNNYDDQGLLDVKIFEDDLANDGQDSLQLEATRHIACTGPGVLAVKKTQYLFSFDYQSPNGSNAGYYLGFNDPDRTKISQRLSIPDSEWQNFNKIIKIPSGATTVSLVIYSYAKDNKTNIITRYDNFHLIELPDIEDRYYLVSQPDRKLEPPEQIDFELINPTKKKVHITGATTSFFLAMSESYHDQWRLMFDNQKIQGFFKSWIPWAKPDKIENADHFKLNNFLNAWYIDVDKFCQQENKCHQNNDGSYNLEMQIEFWPQRLFYLGLLISVTTLMGCFGYLVWKKIRQRGESMINDHSN